MSPAGNVTTAVPHVPCCGGDRNASDHSTDVAVGAFVMIVLVLGVITMGALLWLRRRVAKQPQDSDPT